MPHINITEVDLTSPGLVDETSNVVYVPGLAKMLPSNFEKYKPRLYTSLRAFQADFGDKVPTIGLGTNASGHPSFQDEYKAFDTGYIYATELLRLGCPVLYDCMNNLPVDESSRKYFYNGKIKDTKPDDNTHYNILTADDLMYMRDEFVKEVLKDDYINALKDKGLYSIKFVSNGGYPELNQRISDLAGGRQDCVAIIDMKYTSNIKSSITEGITSSKIQTLSGMSSYDNESSKYQAMFVPWATYAPTCIQRYGKQTLSSDEYIPTLKDDQSYDYYPDMVELPGSFGYLMAMANAIKNGSNNWLAMAGAKRGSVPFLKALKEDITQADIEILQARNTISINPIATINPFGVLIWGNRTLYNNQLKGNLTASSFLNIRNLCSDVKKTIWASARRMTFEQNSDILWVNFKSYVTPTLDQMVSGGCLAGYELKKRVAKQKATLDAIIRLYAIEAVEDFEIEIQLADDSTAIIE